VERAPANGARFFTSATGTQRSIALLISSTDNFHLLEIYG
jgi:hypothetical protein